jgi:hypothetical protein
MKRYRLVRNQQLEFAFLNEPPVSESAPHVEAVAETDISAAEEGDL